MQSKSMKNTQAFSKLRKWWVQTSYHLPLNLFIRKKIFKELQKLKSKKACQGSDIPVKIIKENINIVTNCIYNNFNNSLFSSYFPSNLKNADITPVFRKQDRENVENYRLVSILMVLSKVYERCMYDQMYSYFRIHTMYSNVFKKWQCGFRQGYSTLPSNQDRKIASVFR